MSVNIFMQIDGIPGESKDKQHKDQIDVQSWSWGASNSASVAAGGAGVGKVQFQPFVFTHHFDKASPKLLLACAKGLHIAQAVLREVKPSGAPSQYLTITMNDVLITSVATSDAGQGPEEMVAMQAAKVQLEYRPQKPDGSLDGPVTMGWDVKQNKDP